MKFIFAYAQKKFIHFFQGYLRISKKKKKIQIQSNDYSRMYYFWKGKITMRIYSSCNLCFRIDTTRRTGPTKLENLEWMNAGVVGTRSSGRWVSTDPSSFQTLSLLFPFHSSTVPSTSSLPLYWKWIWKQCCPCYKRWRHTLSHILFL